MGRVDEIFGDTSRWRGRVASPSMIDGRQTPTAALEALEGIGECVIPAVTIGLTEARLPGVNLGLNGASQCPLFWPAVASSGTP